MDISSTSSSFLSRANRSVNTDSDGFYEISTGSGTLTITVTKSDGTVLGSFSIKIDGEKTPEVSNDNPGFRSSEPKALSRPVSGGSVKPAFSYESASYSFLVGQIAFPILPRVTAGKITSCAVSPSLPAGLNVKQNCAIVGIPSSASSSSVYKITGSNSAGDVSVSLSIAITSPDKPLSLSYSNPYNLLKGQRVSILPAYNGGKLKSCSSNLSLMGLGLFLDPFNCSITGIATTVHDLSDFTITARNASGTISNTLKISIKDPTLPPSSLNYSLTTLSFTVGVPISPFSPTVNGVVSSYTISPALPSGLTLNTNTGVLSGTPTVAKEKTSYAITASNTKGSTTLVVSLEVVAATVAPSSFSYSSATLSLVTGTAITPISPSITGNPTSYSATLPNGLQVHPTTGVLSGTPTTAQAENNYTITASNSVGSTTFSIRISITNPVVAPSNLSYTSSVLNLFVNVNINPLSPTISGSVATYSVSPAFPLDITLNPQTGVIGGKPSNSAVQQEYTITATNSKGSTTFKIKIAVSFPVVAPTNLSYGALNLNLTSGVAMNLITPTVNGTVSSYTYSSLPSGLSVNSNTGVLSGTPSTPQSQTSYTITASNSAGSTSVNLSISITAPVIAPSGLSYTTNTLNLNVGTQITSLSPTVTGTVSAYSVSPNLPEGLNLNTSTGVLSGTPAIAATSQIYTIRASNSAGGSTFGITITVVNRCILGNRILGQCILGNQ